MDDNLKILYIADIVGVPGCNAVSSEINKLKEIYDVDFTIANGENSKKNGKGMDPKSADFLFRMGIDVITTGNHIWNSMKIYDELDRNQRILRPINYPAECPGHGSCVVKLSDDIPVGVINLQGRAFMYTIDCPFHVSEKEIERLHDDGVKIIVVDFHAEATAEKVAMGYFLNGKVSAVIGSHTHVQTADEKILSSGTAYITDAGMTGAFDSIIGMQIDQSIKRFITQLPVITKVAKNDCKICGVVITVDKMSGRSIDIERYQISVKGDKNGTNN